MQPYMGRLRHILLLAVGRLRGSRVIQHCPIKRPYKRGDGSTADPTWSVTPSGDLYRLRCDTSFSNLWRHSPLRGLDLTDRRDVGVVRKLSPTLWCSTPACASATRASQPGARSAADVACRPLARLPARGDGEWGCRAVLARVTTRDWVPSGGGWSPSPAPIRHAVEGGEMFRKSRSLPGGVLLSVPMRSLC